MQNHKFGFNSEKHIRIGMVFKSTNGLLRFYEIFYRVG